MARSGRYQIVGDEQALGKSPVGSPSSNPRSGKFQMVGDAIRMSQSPVHSPSSNPRSGKFDLVGDCASLNHAAVKGLTGKSSITLSHAAMAQSSNAAERGGKRKRK